MSGDVSPLSQSLEFFLHLIFSHSKSPWKSSFFCNIDQCPGNMTNERLQTLSSPSTTSPISNQGFSPSPDLQALVLSSCQASAETPARRCAGPGRDMTQHVTPSPRQTVIAFRFCTDLTNTTPLVGLWDFKVQVGGFHAYILLPPPVFIHLTRVFAMQMRRKVHAFRKIEIGDWPFDSCA